MLDFDVAWDTMGSSSKGQTGWSTKSHRPIGLQFCTCLMVDDSESVTPAGAILVVVGLILQDQMICKVHHVKLQLCDRSRNVRQSQIFLLFRSDDPIEPFVMIQNLL